MSAEPSEVGAGPEPEAEPAPEAGAEAKPEKPLPAGDLREYYEVARRGWAVWQRESRRVLARFDPNDDPDAEPLTVLPLVLFFTALCFSTWTFLRWKYQPMQDFGHHIALAAVVADYNHPGSLYPALYEAPDPLLANTLMYTIAGYMGRVIGVTLACRLCIAFYIAGVPLANLYALRVFGRSAWPALVSVPLVYNMSFVAGFANYLFAAPFMVAQIPLFHRAISGRGWRWTAASALLFVLIFLAHAQVFLWTGFICAAMTLAAIAFRLLRVAGARARAMQSLRIAGRALATVAPSGLLFLRWYAYAFGEGRDAGGVSNATGSLGSGLGAFYHTPAGLFRLIGDYALRIFQDEQDIKLLSWLAIAVLCALVFARWARWRRPPVLEAVFAITVASYFFLPESITGQEVIGTRQLGASLWFVAALLVPIPSATSRMARFVVIGATVLWTWSALKSYYEHLSAFEAEGGRDLHCALDDLPPRLRMHHVKLDSSMGKIFLWKSYWHGENYYMGDAFGQAADNPAINSTSPIRYKSGVDYHRITVHPPSWFRMEELWKNFDLVLVRGWNPSAADYQEAARHGTRIRKCGAFEVWRTHGPWETGDAPVRSE